MSISKVKLKNKMFQSKNKKTNYISHSSQRQNKKLLNRAQSF